MPGPHVLWVWQDKPPAARLTGYDAVCVKISDGRMTHDKGGFDWAANGRAWVASMGQGHVAAWQVAYPDDGSDLAVVAAGAMPHAPYIILDAEDWPGVTWNDGAIRAIVGGYRQHLPGVRIGYTTYPTRAQCADHHINQALWDSLCDFAVPQVYFGYQRDELAQVWKDHRHAHPMISPADDAGWVATAQAAMQHSGGVMYWRMGAAGWATWWQRTTQPTPPVASGGTAVDALRPTDPVGFPPGRFVAWSGTGWYVTDLIHRSPVPEDTARALHQRGVPVVAWPQVTSVTLPA